jgi:hypothetical protein
VLKTIVYVIFGWVDLYLGFGLKNFQENQVNQASFIGLFAGVRTKCSSSMHRLLVHLLMFGRLLR